MLSPVPCAAVVLFVFCLCVPSAGSVSDEHCLIISEVNADNPKLDTTEFVELYHTGGQRASLDGYTLVFYNGNGNIAYKVIDLKSYATDERGFFLVGSVDVQPPPAIPLPPNTVQNGPDAVALYRSEAARYAERMNVTATGLVDAVVYATRRAGGAERLAEVLTPGTPAFLEDEAAHEGDESIERCLLSEDLWGFGVAPPSPGRRNHCAPPDGPATRITELKLGGGQSDGFVELSVSRAAGPLVLLALDGRTGAVGLSVDVDTTEEGLVSITVDRHHMKGEGAGAVAVYGGRAADFPVGGALSRREPLDAFVYAGLEDTLSAELVETLIPGRTPFPLSTGSGEGGVYLSCCGIAGWTRDPGVFREAPQTPGQPNQCPWPKICPHSVVVPGSTEAPLPPWSWGDFLLNEVNADTPGAAEDSEFVELRHPSGRRTSLEGVWLLLFSGHDSRPYRQIGLTGYFTDARGYFLVGGDKVMPAPSVRLPPNTIQNGPDAVALYRSPHGPPSGPQSGIPTEGLLDAVVYRLPGSDKDAQELSDALTPGQLPLLEDPSVHSGDESLSRCYGVKPADLSAFVVAPPTPLKENACPRPPTLPPPPEGVVINEVASAVWTNHSAQQAFVELRGPPLTQLRGLILILFESDRDKPTFLIPLSGATDRDGFYLIGNVIGADQPLPSVSAHGALLLCYHSLSVCEAGTTNSYRSLRDMLIFNSEPQPTTFLSATRWQPVTPAISSMKGGPVSLSRCACCEANSNPWTTSSPTPRQGNLCPSAAFSSTVHFCLATGQDRENCTATLDQRVSRERELADYLEQTCKCGVSAVHLQGTNVSCLEGLLQVSINVLALSVQQRALIVQASNELPSPVHGHTCTGAATDRLMGTESALGLQIGLVVAVLVLAGVGAALVTYLYKRRRPLDYYSMELNEHAEGPA